MRFTKKVSYKLAKPLTTLALVAASFGCNKDDKEDLTPIHDTVYTFNINIENPDQYIQKVAESADSASVRNVILKGDGSNWGGAVNVNELRHLYIERILNGVSEKNRSKVKGEGNVPYIAMDDTDATTYKQHQADSVWVNKFGLNMSPVFYLSSRQK